jgi:hypothetical protein
MDPTSYVDPELTIADHLVLDTLVDKPGSNGECFRVRLLTAH